MFLTPATKGSCARGANYLKQIAKTLFHAGLDVTMLAAKMLPQDPGQMSLGFLTVLWDGQSQASAISPCRKCVVGTEATIRTKIYFLVAPSPRGMLIPATKDVPKEEDFIQVVYRREKVIMLVSVQLKNFLFGNPATFGAVLLVGNGSRAVQGSQATTEGHKVFALRI